jgi:hypothetical protein
MLHVVSVLYILMIHLKGDSMAARPHVALEIAKLRGQLKDAIAKEKKAMSRLRRWQTAYDKYYERRARLQDQLTAAYDEADIVAARLTTATKEK